MLQTLFARALSRTAAPQPAAYKVGALVLHSLLVSMALWASPASACTEVGDAGRTATPTLNSAEGLKLRMRQPDAVRSASLTQPPLALAAADETGDRHTYKPVAMLVAALALMVSIALRRSGKY